MSLGVWAGMDQNRSIGAEMPAAGPFLALAASA